jgi:VIT1/CCC1 family predicted Fe2+/Mn2+ transporter
VSAGAVGAALGILGYFLGSRKLAVAIIVIGILAIFVVAAADTSLIPWGPPATATTSNGTLPTRHRASPDLCT